MRLVEERERKLAALDAALAQGLADVEAGRGKPADEVFDRLEAKYKTLSDDGKPISKASVIE